MKIYQVRMVDYGLMRDCGLEQADVLCKSCLYGSLEGAKAGCEKETRDWERELTEDGEENIPRAELEWKEDGEDSWTCDVKEHEWIFAIHATEIEN